MRTGIIFTQGAFSSDEKTQCAPHQHTAKIKPELKKNPKLAKVEGTKVGKLGIELAYDKELQGKFGIKKEEVNAFGRVVNEVSRVNGIPGKNVSLSISKDLQNYCYEMLENKAGSIAVMDLSNGEVLSLVSRPSFDSNDSVLIDLLLDK